MVFYNCCVYVNFLYYRCYCELISKTKIRKTMYRKRKEKKENWVSELVCYFVSGNSIG